MSRRVFVSLCVLVVLAPRPIRAEPVNAAPGSCDRESTALGKSACTLANALNGAGDALVVAAAVAGDERVAVPPAGVARLAQLLAARLGPAARADAQTSSLAEAKRQAGSARGLVYLSLSLYRDRLDVSADLYLGAGHFWRRVRSPGLRLATHGFASSPLDPELRALFPPIPLVVSRVDKVSLPDNDVLALACGDVRGDGSNELALIGRRRVQVGRLVHGQFVTRAALNWADFSAISPNPVQQPIATATLPEPGRLWVGLSDRADALDLSGALHVEHEWHGLMPWPGGGCTRRAGVGYEGVARACPNEEPGLAVDFATPVDAFASRAVEHGGQPRMLRVARAVGSDGARALDSLHPEVSVPNVGAQIAVGDLDEDGLPEIVSSSPNLDREADQLLVRTLSDNGQLRERLRVPVPSGIDALAICPGDGRAMAPLALATGDGIWVIR